MTQPGVLSGMRLVEAAAFVAAPLGGMTLAQMGADVIRIDTVGGGLDYRRWPVTDDGTSLFWTGLNKSKRSVVLDLATPEGRELAQAIATAPGDGAGLFLTNFPPRGWLDFDKLKARRSDLIQLTLMGDRHGGSAVDYTVNARIGLPYMTGPKEGKGAVNHVLPAWDLVTGQMVAVGLLAAERHRLRTGEGQHVKLALEDVALAVMAHLGFITEAELGRPRERHGNDLFGAFGREFETKDGERVMLVGLTLKQWKAIVEACGIEEQVRQLESKLGADLSREGERFRHREALAALVGPWVAARTLSEVRCALEKAGACWGGYQDIATLVRDDASCSTGNPMFQRIEQPGVGKVLAPGIPLDFGARERSAPAPAPLLGQHTEQVLTELLGLPGTEFGRLHDRGIVRTAGRS
jgi:2-methylfumaryl-CoA isomerase